MSMSECELLTVKFEAELIAVTLDRCEHSSCTGLLVQVTCL